MMMLCEQKCGSPMNTRMNVGLNQYKIPTTELANGMYQVIMQNGVPKPSGAFFECPQCVSASILLERKLP
jgi:hypothetical protein